MAVIIRSRLTSRAIAAYAPTETHHTRVDGPTGQSGLEEMKELCWLKPKLIAQVRFTEWTDYGLLCHATFARVA